MLTPRLAYKSENELAIRRELESIYNEVFQLIAHKQHDLEARVTKDQNQFAKTESKFEATKLIEDMTTAATVHDALDTEYRRFSTELEKLRNEIQFLEADDENFLA